MVTMGSKLVEPFNIPAGVRSRRSRNVQASGRYEQQQLWIMSEEVREEILIKCNAI